MKKRLKETKLDPENRPAKKDRKNPTDEEGDFIIEEEPNLAEEDTGDFIIQDRDK